MRWLTKRSPEPSRAHRRSALESTRIEFNPSRVSPDSRRADGRSEGPLPKAAALPGTDTTGVNLARVLVDGEQVLVGVPAAIGAPVAGLGAPVPTQGAAGDPLDLNAATLDQLQNLPGLGPVLAQRIVDWRTAHGRFTNVDELQEVSGIGAQRLEDLRPLVRV